MKKFSNIQLKELNSQLVSDRYVEWMNDFQITKLTEQRFFKHTKKTIIEFVNEKKYSKNEYLFGIFYVNEKKTHIGNIKLGPINYHHKFAEISYLIGDLRFQNKGLATKAIEQVLSWCDVDHNNVLSYQEFCTRLAHLDQGLLDGSNVKDTIITPQVDRKIRF